MSLAIVHSRAISGIHAPPVTVEVHLANGLPGLSIVGLPETAVKESKDRVRGAIQTCGFEFPARRITINLAPADLPKEGGRFDLPIAIGILAASGQIEQSRLEEMEFIGELALSGEIRPVRGGLSACVQCRAAARTLVLPRNNIDEAARVKDAQLLAAEHLIAICQHLQGQQALPLHQPAAQRDSSPPYPDMNQVMHQAHAKRALEIAAAGGHSLLMMGPPGTGKTLLASRLPGILPAMSEPEAMESAAVWSLQTGHTQPWAQRPFRAPHHSASAVALVGGGSNPRPGEISLAHNGVLFLDELPEFDRKVLEVLREPLESGQILISRAARQAQFPARFQLIAAMNLCPCGYLGDERGRCHCTAEQIQRYRQKLSGPLLDRIDMHIEVPRVPLQKLQGAASGESSAQIRIRVQAARDRQHQRQGGTNAHLDNEQLQRVCRLRNADQDFLVTALDELGLSARAYHRVLKLARTLADLSAQQDIGMAHLSEALSYRKLDRLQRAGT